MYVYIQAYHVGIDPVDGADIYICMYVCIYVCMYMYIGIYIYIHIPIYLCSYVSIYCRERSSGWCRHTCMYVCMYAYICIYICICTCIYLYKYIFMFIYEHTLSGEIQWMVHMEPFSPTSRPRTCFSVRPRAVLPSTSTNTSPLRTEPRRWSAPPGSIPKSDTFPRVSSRNVMHGMPKRLCESLASKSLGRVDKRADRSRTGGACELSATCSASCREDSRPPRRLPSLLCEVAPSARNIPSRPDLGVSCFRIYRRI